MIPKRTFEELVLLYETETGLLDIFCEGAGDNAVLRFFVNAIEHRNTAVFDADQIEWPEEASSEGGNRSKIIFLSNELTNRNLQGICIVGKDHDAIENSTPLNDKLVKTDYSCMNMYGLDVDDLVTFIYSTFNVQLTIQQISSVLETCKELFVIRFLREKHAKGSSICHARYVISDAKSLRFGLKEYLQRCKQLNGFDARWDKIIEDEEALVRGLVGDIRHFINVHDLGELLAVIVRSLKSKSVTIEDNFIAKHLSYVLLGGRNFGYPLFAELSQRLVPRLAVG